VHAERRRGKSRSRILYWFRTPPGVKVGRAALDEDAIRRIEELNPSVEFDWTQILKGGQSGPVPAPRPPARQDRRPEREAGAGWRSGRGPERVRREAHGPSPPGGDIPPSVEHLSAAGLSPEDLALEEPVAAIDGAAGSGDRDYRAEVPAEAPAPVPPAEPVGDALMHEAPPTAAHARLGAEGVLRLRARHAEILARISERIPDPVRREELKAQAERLNPDTWVTADEVAAGLDQYEIVFEGLRSAIGGPRRKRRRRSGSRGSSGGRGGPVAGGGGVDGSESGDEAPDSGSDSNDDDHSV
jgi:hypothetical protein